MSRRQKKRPVGRPRVTDGERATARQYGLRIRELRSRSGLTQAAAAELAGISQTQLCSIESGDLDPVGAARRTIRRVTAICEAVGATRAEILAILGLGDQPRSP